MDQTVRSHTAIMEGCIERVRFETKRDVVMAWRIANFQRAKRLRTVSHYLKELEPAKAQTAEEVIAFFDALAENGRVTIVETGEAPNAG